MQGREVFPRGLEALTTKDSSTLSERRLLIGWQQPLFFNLKIRFSQLTWQLRLAKGAAIVLIFVIGKAFWCR